MQTAKKSPRRLIVRTLLLAAIAGAGLALYHYKPWGPSQAEQKAAANTVAVTKGDISDVVTSQGKLEPKKYVDVGAQVSGKVMKLYVDIGDTVTQGAPIADIDPQIYQSKVQGEEANLKTLTAQKAEQEARVVQTKQKVARNKKLFDVHALSQEAYQDSVTDQKVAEAQLNSVAAQIEQAEYNLQGDRTSLGYTKIYAPMSGSVVSQTAREGQTLNANQTTPTIVQLADLDIMTVKAQVAEADVPKIKDGMAVYFTILGSDRRWQAKVDQVLPTPETINDVVLYDVLVDVDNRDRQLMSGMSTQMFFELGSAKDVLTVPTSILKTRLPDKDTNEGKAYEVKVYDGKAQQNRVAVIGLQDRTRAQVISGLNEGDKAVMPAAATTSQTGGQPPQGKPGSKAATAMRGMPRL